MTDRSYSAVTGTLGHHCLIKNLLGFSFENLSQVTSNLPGLIGAALVGCQLGSEWAVTGPLPGEVAVTGFSGGHHLLHLLMASLLCGWDRDSCPMTQHGRRRPGKQVICGAERRSRDQQADDQTQREIILFCICKSNRTCLSFIIRRKGFYKLILRKILVTRKEKQIFTGLYDYPTCQQRLEKLRHETASNEAELSISAVRISIIPSRTWS